MKTNQISSWEAQNCASSTYRVVVFPMFDWGVRIQAQSLDKPGPTKQTDNIDISPEDYRSLGEYFTRLADQHEGKK